MNGLWRKYRARVMSMMLHGCTHGTHIAASILEGSKRLQEVSATRRILFVLTDGQDSYGRHAGHRACEIARMRGVEVVVIGLFSDVTGMYPVTLTVRDATQLARQGLGSLVSELEAANRKRA